MSVLWRGSKPRTGRQRIAQGKAGSAAQPWGSGGWPSPWVKYLLPLASVMGDLGRTGGGDVRRDRVERGVRDRCDGLTLSVGWATCVLRERGDIGGFDPTGGIESTRYVFLCQSLLTGDFPCLTPDYCFWSPSSCRPRSRGPRRPGQFHLSSKHARAFASCSTDRSCLPM